MRKEIAQNPTSHGPMMGGSRRGKTGFGLRDGFLKAGASGCEGKQERKGKESGGSAGCLFVNGTISQLAFTVNAGWKTKKKQKTKTEFPKFGQ